MAMSNKHYRFFQGVLPFKWTQFPQDVMAGLTLAALAIPEVMGYTQIAGVPVVTGLYTMLLPMFLFALFGSSRQLVVGADSATAAMLATALAGLAVVGSPEYLALAGVLALMVGVMLLVARVFNLGMLANFLSRTVLIGFLTGVGIQVSLGQIAGMLGVPSGGMGNLFHTLVHWQELEIANIDNMVIAIATLVVIISLRQLSRRIPGALIAVITAILVSWLFNLQQYGIQSLGAVPSGLPRLTWPDVALSWQTFEALIPPAFAMFIVIIAQSAATSRAYAARHGETVNDNGDLIGLGAANIGAALSGSFVVNGSPTKTQMVDSAGGRSQLAHLITAAIVTLVLLLLTAPLTYLPQATLSAVVFLIGVELIDIKGMRSILSERPWEFWVALITTLVVVLWGVEQGILLAIALSLLVHTRHGYQPHNSIIVPSDGGRWRAVTLDKNVQLIPGLLVYRFTHSMYYANASYMRHQIMYLVNHAQPSLQWFCIDAGAVDDIDFTSAKTLSSLYEALQTQTIRLVFAEVADNVRMELDRSGLTQLIGAGAYYETVADVVDAFQKHVK
ncbi:SulP family inorganic anion transporter [Marinomonas spartinae]|uniref:SulP family inorganic anion transporter n=1 Tax=Marinomonas spartinae TaxID=1792290 RepID=UPI0018F1A8EB|nr:SulP family inorganic anion transporter [Marinomonas spartinae]MBJ7553468.1 SulP family inorganic anion transporter [Marinomonas spartinae]